MPFYHYDQNNSGGAFDEPALNVFIEASSDEEADTIAEANGIYFDGVEDDKDCPCCGDRWSRAGNWKSLADEAAVKARLEASAKWDEGWAKSSNIPISLIIRKPTLQGA